MAKDDDRIIFTGFVQGEELDELYSNAYVYTLPSDLEGMPLSLLEAMSYGNCCLVSDIDECASVVEDKALIFEKSNVEQLKRDCRRLATSLRWWLDIKKQQQILSVKNTVGMMLLIKRWSCIEDRIWKRNIMVR